MHFPTTTTVLSLLLTLSSLSTPALSQSDFVPPPPCLSSCMAAQDPCDTCGNSTSAAIRNCVSSTCYFRDVSYASAYFGSVCKNGGYVTEAGSSDSFVKVPAASCAAEATTTTTTTTATATPTVTATGEERREVRFSA